MSWANNALGSVAISDVQNFLKDRPVDASFWENDIIGAIHRWHLVDQTNRKNIRIADLGFGVGGKLVYICDDCVRYGLSVEALGIDLVPANVYKTRKTMATLSNVKVDLRLGDIRKDIPFEKLDFVLISEVVHWMTKDECRVVMKSVSDKCNKGANVVVSYATPYNASALARTDGSIDRKLVTRRWNKNEGYSNSCKTHMSWYKLDEMFAIGRNVGLEPAGYEHINNQTFPAIRQAGLYYDRNGDYYENEVVRFMKT
jgi:hypothetical protein